ncbi:MAG: hypothetical protein K9W44_01880 [Candidatus Lokiarchaeota archaeon]|nr:hypothetical protein [Candidatus Harpocratesius repetitus]
MSFFGQNPEWKQWADRFDVTLDKVVKNNKGCWLTLNLIIDQQTWEHVENLGLDPYFEMTLPQYFTGKMWDRIRIKEIKKVPRENPDEEIFRFEIIRKYDPTKPNPKNSPNPN